MPDRGDALFGAFAAGRAKRIGRHIDVRSQSVFVGEPTEVTRRKRLFQGSNSLKGLVRRFSPDEQGNRFIGCEATSEEVSGGAGSISSTMVWHVSPQIPVRSGSVWHRGRSREAPALRGGCGGPAAARHARQNQPLLRSQLRYRRRWFGRGRASPDWQSA